MTCCNTVRFRRNARKETLQHLTNLAMRPMQVSSGPEFQAGDYIRSEVAHKIAGQVMTGEVFLQKFVH